MDNKEALLKQYELMTNTSQNVTTWRQNANTFYLTLNTALLSLILYTSNSSGFSEKIGLTILGITISVLWFYSIDYYRKLNTAKFDVIYIMERKLPLKMFKLEYARYKNKVKEITKIEKYLPLLFLIAYVVVFFS